MANKTNRRQYLRKRRKQSIRKKFRGTAERPRLSVFRSNKHIYAQIIDDISGQTLASASTKSAEFEGGQNNAEAATAVGTLIAEKAKAAKIVKVVFDRNGFLYHGRIQALADAAREGGLDF